MTLTSPRVSLPNVLSLLDTFASLSGLKINHTKSKAMSVNLSSPELEALKTAFPFHWCQGHGCRRTGNVAQNQHGRPQRVLRCALARTSAHAQYDARGAVQVA